MDFNGDGGSLSESELPSDEDELELLPALLFLGLDSGEEVGGIDVVPGVATWVDVVPPFADP